MTSVMQARYNPVLLLVFSMLEEQLSQIELPNSYYKTMYGQNKVILLLKKVVSWRYIYFVPGPPS